ncbi:hypothetical protein BDP27DRAFT_133832 [Rhodocollybia butyracea]|uniref:Uncharacterized protein n=1 Tax=Rhodocollybia butyracea TaxID=206335 RepID=A0A9P5PIS9_9AGAR|nr:hypothetical protein BDP27DRAFT_133832 [Rhodocollybia butyracea]
MSTRFFRRLGSYLRPNCCKIIIFQLVVVQLLGIFVQRNVGISLHSFHGLSWRGPLPLSYPKPTKSLLNIPQLRSRSLLCLLYLLLSLDGLIEGPSFNALGKFSVLFLCELAVIQDLTTLCLFSVKKSDNAQLIQKLCSQRLQSILTLKI